MINRGTVPTKIDRVLTVTVLPRCSPGLSPGSITMSSRCRPVCVPIHPVVVPVHPGGVPVHLGPATDMSRCLPVLVNQPDCTGLNRKASRVNPRKPWLIVAKFLKPVCPGGVPVHPGGVPVHPGAVSVQPGADTVTHGLRRIITVSPRFNSVFDISPGSPWISPVLFNILYNREGSPVYPGSPR